MSSKWCLETLGTKRLENAWGRGEFQTFGQVRQQWRYVMQFWALGVFRGQACVGFVENDLCMYKQRGLSALESQKYKLQANW